MARRFLYLVAALTGLVIALMIALAFWAEDLSELAFVPDGPFSAPPLLAADAYEDSGMWISRPGTGAFDPARWLPRGYSPAAGELEAAVFVVHPSGYMAREAWNAPLDDAETRRRAEDDVRTMASVFNASADIWAPRYRQAAYGAFLTDRPEADKALDAAFGDVVLAFDHFVARVAPGKPLILAGEGQGAFLLRRLLVERVAGKPLAARIAVVYAPGWPISRKGDLPAIGLPACTARAQPGCVMSWMTFAEPADPAMVFKARERRAGRGGGKTAGPPFLCTNPLTGDGGAAPASANPGTLVPTGQAAGTSLVPAIAGARCAPDGLLLIGEAPQIGNRVQPGNNYTSYDFALFWAALRADAAQRVKAWQSRR